MPVGRIRKRIEEDAFSGDKAVERRGRARSRSLIAVEIVRGDDTGEPHLAAIGEPKRGAITGAGSFIRRRSYVGTGTGGPCIGSRDIGGVIRECRERQ
jgi:hypothetical protein